jgi:hypothetical protein
MEVFMMLEEEFRLIVCPMLNDIIVEVQEDWQQEEQG